MHSNNKEFPEGMQPLGEGSFTFNCHPDVSCFTVCCQKVDLTLYPYDVIRLKNFLGIDSEEFMRKNTFLVKGDNPFFPTVKLRLTDDGTGVCPYLKEDGCSVYTDRPSACRTYPLERAVDRSPGKKDPQEYYFMTDHDYCKGHLEKRKFTVEGYLRNQKAHEFNTMNSLWAELDTLFAANPWKGEGAAGDKQQLSFMVCYNVDAFRRFVDSHQLLRQFRLEKDRRRRIESEDAELLKFGFEWLKLVLTGRSSLVKK